MYLFGWDFGRAHQGKRLAEQNEFADDKVVFCEKPF